MRSSTFFWYICGSEGALPVLCNINGCVMMDHKGHSYFYVVAVLLFGSLFLSSCGKQKQSTSGGLFGASGTPMEMVAVVPLEYDTPALRDSIKATFGRPMPILPQAEPMVTVMTTTEKNFTQMFKTMRNVLYISIDPEMYTRPSVGLAHDQYASGQLIIHAKAGSVEDFYKLLRQRGGYLTDIIHSEEMKRMSMSFETTYSSALAKLIQDSIGGWTINATNLLKFTNTADDFVWASDQGQKGRTDLMIYTYPLETVGSLEPSHIIAMRDSVLQRNVKGQYEDSYMTTEKRIPPKVKKFEYNGTQRVELRGLWAMVGDMMGGPFVLHAVPDVANGRVVVAEMSIFNPGGKKKSLMVYAESQLYTLRPVTE